MQRICRHSIYACHVCLPPINLKTCFFIPQDCGDQGSDAGTEYSLDTESISSSIGVYTWDSEDDFSDFDLDSFDEEDEPDNENYAQPSAIYEEIKDTHCDYGKDNNVSSQGAIYGNINLKGHGELEDERDIAIFDPIPVKKGTDYFQESSQSDTLEMLASLLQVRA